MASCYTGSQLSELGLHTSAILENSGRPHLQGMPVSVVEKNFECFWGCQGQCPLCAATVSELVSSYFAAKPPELVVHLSATDDLPAPTRSSLLEGLSLMVRK